MGGYFFGDEYEEEERRLRAVEAYSDPASRGVLRELVEPGSVCWEVGAGAGSIAAWLSDVVGPDGHVLATDIDIRRLHACSNLTVQHHDVVQDELPEGEFDLIHGRFLLEHLPEPESVLSRLSSLLCRDGWLMVEDADGLDLAVVPDVPQLCGRRRDRPEQISDESPYLTWESPHIVQDVQSWQGCQQ
jgi:2-polyprenyl-3-methyl-5-hydroxy-6-metoxy-1,4-benzoquinol methylase